MIRLKLFVAVFFAICVSACSTGAGGDKTSVDVYVSIAPLRYLVERIADSSVKVAVLVPETTSPETYEPSLQQIKDLSRSRGYIAVGLIDFEVELRGRVEQFSSNGMMLLELSDGVQIMEGSCSHANHSTGDSADQHGHGVDPHTWLSPSLVRGFAVKIAGMMDQLFPENTELHRANLNALLEDIDTLDKYARSKTEALSNRNVAIVHPSLTYFVRDYGLRQLAIETEGKEPSVQQLKNIIAQVRQAECSVVLYQRQVSSAAAQAVASQLSIDMVEYDPLAENWLDNMYMLINVIVDGTTQN